MFITLQNQIFIYIIKSIVAVKASTILHSSVQAKYSLKLNGCEVKSHYRCNVGVSKL